MIVDVDGLLFHTVDVVEFDHFVILPVIETLLNHYFCLFKVDEEVSREEHFTINKL